MTKLWNLSEELMMGPAGERRHEIESRKQSAKKGPAEAGPFVHNLLLLTTATTGRRISQ
jgi:hypothetical protein